MSRLVIAGAGGFGRGVRGWIQQSPEHRRKHGIEEVVFVDDSYAPGRHDVCGDIDTYRKRPDDLVLCAIGDPSTRAQVVERLADRGVIFHTFIDDHASVGDGVRVGEGSIVCPGSVISADATISRHVHINFNCSVGHDVVLGEFSTLSPSVNIMGEAQVGARVFFGGSAVILPRLEVGYGAVVGAGAVAVRSVSARTTVVGNPARQRPSRGASS